ncbi:MAG TPA: CmcJ/NvfI family oxidoreductase [Xanthobacteraceae bacterium]|nr:CmcJ/NvfI family oxidoreductase [Xanthobacteraceae bacterium]
MTAKTTAQADVKSTFRYTRDTGVTPEVYFYEPPPGTKWRESGDDPHEMTVHDGRDRAKSFTLDREGFAFRDLHSSFVEWDDDEAIRTKFYGTVEQFVQNEVGASRVIIFDHTIRSQANLTQNRAERSTSRRAPVMNVHCDYTPNSGPLRVRQLLPNQADELLKRRVAFYNFWKPLRRTVEERPLAMCDVTSSTEQEFIVMKLRYRDRDGEIFVMRHSPKHKWWYFPRMTPDHAIMLKTYDSMADGRARFVGHSAFEDPTTPPNAPMRESIEIRTMAFF